MSSGLPARGGRRADGSTPSAPGAAATEGKRAQQSRERSSAESDARAAKRVEREQAAGLGAAIGGGQDEVSASELGSQRQPTVSDGEASTPPGRRGGRARRGLATPRAARKAIVLREVLGPPVALRSTDSDVPGLTSPRG